MTKPTGRPRGRPPKIGHERVAKITKIRQAAAPKEILPLFGLTDDQIAALTPKEFFRHSLHDAVKRGDLLTAREAAKDWAPYEHARPIADRALTPEELHRIADLARSEANRRSPNFTPAPGNPLSTLRN